MKKKTLLFTSIFLLFALSADGNEHQVPKIEPGTGKALLYTAKKLGAPIIRTVIHVEHRSGEEGKSFYRIYAQVDSLPNLKFLFRMKNRFTSLVEVATCLPVQYIKQIDQGGPFIKDKHYHQTLTFDLARQKVTVEKEDQNEKREIPISAGTYDPLSLFARYYLKEEIRPGQDIPMSIFDGVKLRHMVFHSKIEKLSFKQQKAMEAVCLESVTPFSTFGDQEGIIRIWYMANGEKLPIILELDLPVGSVRFELEEIRERYILQDLSTKFQMERR